MMKRSHWATAAAAAVAFAVLGSGVATAARKAEPVVLPCTADYAGGTFSCPLPPASTVIGTETQPGTTVTETAPGTTETVTEPGTTVTETTVSNAPGTTVTTTRTVPGPTTTVTATSTVTPTPPAPGQPSGQVMPVGNIPGWTQVMTDDFTDPTLSNTKWHAEGYSGEIPSAPGAYWAGSQVQVRDGKLILETKKIGTRWTSGGVMARQPLAYGKVLIRTRIDKAAGIKYAHLLWPQSPDTWYTGGEIDYAEDGGGNRTGTTGTVIWFINGQPNSKTQIQRQAAADFSQWHTLGVEWSPGKLVYTLDGAVFGTVDNANVPDGVMKMALQTEALLTCSQWNTCVGTTTPAVTNAEFDWVALYTRNP